MAELWKDICGFEGRYQISNMGNVLSLNFNNTGNPRCLRQMMSDNGYCTVIFYKKSHAIRFYVHRLVAEAFLDNPHGYKEVNHKDGNKQNNSVTNLEWCSSKQNKLHALVNGLNDNMVRAVIKQMKPIRATKLETGEQFLFYSLRDAAEFTGANKANISKALHKSKASCYGFAFEYAEKGGGSLCRDLILSKLRRDGQRKDLFSTSRLLREVVY